MKNIQYALIMIFALMTSMAFAQEKPYLVIEDNGEKYEVLLKIDNADQVELVNVLGQYIADGEKKMLRVKIDAETLQTLNGGMALVHELEKCCDVASYTVLVTDKNGEVNGYPEVTVDLNSIAMKNAFAHDAD